MYEDELDELTNNEIMGFVSKMMLNSVFTRLPRNFTFTEFGKSFKKTFKGTDEGDVMNAFLMALDMELIDNDEIDETYSFNGISWSTEDPN